MREFAQSTGRSRHLLQAHRTEVGSFCYRCSSHGDFLRRCRRRQRDRHRPGRWVWRGRGRPGSCVLAGAGRTGGCDALGDASQQPAAPSRVTPRFGEARRRSCSLSRETWRDSTATHFLDRKKQQVGIFLTYYTVPDVNVRDVRNPLPAACPYLSPPQPSTRLRQVGAGRRWAVQVAKRVN